MKVIVPIASLLIVAVFVSCSGFVKQKNNIDVYINPADSGWYFIELIKDSATPEGDVEIRYDTVGGLPKVQVSGIENYNFRIFGNAGEKISAQVKMPAFVYHTSGHNFFRFYNPSAEAFADESNWDPKGQNLERLREQSIAMLNLLLSQP